MSTELIVDAVVVPALDRDSAVELDTLIRGLVRSINGDMAELEALVDEAKQGQIHEALGFASWTAYVADVFTVKVRLDRDRRRELVGYLSGEGMSQRAIAEVVGVSPMTVNGDLAAGVQKRTPEPDLSVADQILDILTDDDDDDADDDSDIDAVDGVCIHCGDRLPLAELYEGGQGYECDPCVQPNDEPAQPAPTPPPDPRPTITGLDGKTYPAAPTTPKEPRRKPITDQARDAGWNLRKAVERIERIAADDRFDAQMKKVAPEIRGHLVNAIEVCQHVLDRINNNQE